MADLLLERRSAEKRPSLPTVHERRSAPLTGFWLLWSLLLVSGGAARLVYGFDADELQNLHYAWNLGQGLRPFQDFFEHHPPLFQYLLVPFVRSLTAPGLSLLLAFRLLASGIAALLLFLFYRLLRGEVSRLFACLGVGVLLCVHPFGTSLFELRADWIALVCLLGAIVLQKRESLVVSLVAGMLCGISLCLTQKSAFVLVGWLLWQSGRVLCANRQERRRQFEALLLLLAGAGTSLGGLAWLFAGQGSLTALWQHCILINLRWASEGTWRYTAQQSLLPAFPVFVLAAAELVLLLRRPATALRQTPFASLIGVLLLLGTLSLLTTPVPHPQSFFFFVVPWSVFLAIKALERVRHASFALREVRLSFGIGILVCLAALSWQNALAVVLVWGSVLWFLRNYAPTEATQRLLLTVLVLGGLVYGGRVVDAFLRQEGAAQARFMAFAESRTAPGEPILETWPLVTPFHPQPSYHGFARRGIVQTAGISALEDEYIAAVEQGRATVAIVDDKDIRRQLPRFAAYLETHGLTVPEETPATRDRLRLYLLSAPHREATIR